jgi:peptide/nickel transport system substrate-binding protein
MRVVINGIDLAESSFVYYRRLSSTVARQAGPPGSTTAARTRTQEEEEASMGIPARSSGRRLARVALAATALTATLGLAACGGSGSGSGDGGGTANANATDNGGGTKPASTGGAKPVLRIGVTSAGPLNPAVNNDQTLDSISYETITHIKPDGSIGPGLATKWGYVGSGNKVFEFTLRPDAKFSDGTPVDAAAVKKWFAYFAKAGGPFASVLAIKSVTTTGDDTVRVTLSKANPVLPWVFGDIDLWGAIASPKAVDNPKGLNDATAGAGPYTLVPSDTVVNDHYTFVPNKYYHDPGAIKFSKVQVKVIGTPTSMLQALQSGQIDVAQGDPSTAPAAGQNGVTVSKDASKTAQILLTNLTKGPWADIRVRQALNHAIDRKAVTAGLFTDYAAPTSQFVTEDGFDAAKYQNYYTYDPAKAKALLAAAGHANDLTLKLVAGTASGNAGVPMAQAVAKYLKAVGITVKITTASTAQSELQMGLSGDYDGWQMTGGTAPTWYLYAGAYAPNGAYNLGHNTDSVMEKLAATAAGAKDPAQYWPQIMGRSVTQAYSVPIAALDTVWYAKGVQGVAAPRFIQGKPLVSWWSPAT